MSSLPIVSEQNFEAEVLRSQVPVLVEFGAQWCGPCKTVAPELVALSQDLGEKAKILQVDVDQSPQLAQMLRIQSVPTYIVFNEGRPVDAAQGAMKKAQIKTLLEPYLPRAAGAIAAKEAAQLVQAGRVTPVDIREAQVFARTHIESAVSFPKEELDSRLAELNMLPAPALLYCRTGKDAQETAAKLAEQGMPVAFLEGGVLSWEAEGFRLVRPQ